MTSSKNGKKTTQRVALVGTTVAALLGGGIAFAAWTSTGTGTGTATAGNQGAGNLEIIASPVSGLYPTASKPQSVTVVNNNPYPVQLDSLTSQVEDLAADACDITSVGHPTFGYIAPGAHAVYTFDVAMGFDAAEGCKSGGYNITYLASASSVDKQ